MKKKQESKLRKLIELWREADTEEKEFKSLKAKAQAGILAIYKEVNIKYFEHNGRSIRQQTNTSQQYMARELKAFISRTVGLREANKAVKEEKIINLVVDEDVLRKLIKQKKITQDEIKTFINETESAPFLRHYAIKPTEDE